MNEKKTRNSIDHKHLKKLLSSNHCDVGPNETENIVLLRKKVWQRPVELQAKWFVSRQNMTSVSSPMKSVPGTIKFPSFKRLYSKVFSLGYQQREHRACN